MSDIGFFSVLIDMQSVKFINRSNVATEGKVLGSATNDFELKKSCNNEVYIYQYYKSLYAAKDTDTIIPMQLFKYS